MLFDRLYETSPHSTIKSDHLWSVSASCFFRFPSCSFGRAPSRPAPYLPSWGCSSPGRALPVSSLRHSSSSFLVGSLVWVDTSLPPEHPKAVPLGPPVWPKCLYSAFTLVWSLVAVRKSSLGILFPQNVPLVSSAVEKSEAILKPFWWQIPCFLSPPPPPRSLLVDMVWIRCGPANQGSGSREGEGAGGFIFHSHSLS